MWYFEIPLPEMLGLIESTAVLLDKMSGFEFEELVADILTKLGYGHVEQVLYTQDGGKDILIHSPNGLIVVECKHQPKTSIGRPVVQKLHSAVITSKAIKGILVTTGRFTKEALDYAAKLTASGTPIEMVDRPILADMATRANVTLISGKQKLSVYSYNLPSEQETNNALSSKIASISLCSPRHPSDLLNSVHRVVTYRPVYSILYNLNSTFETSVGIVHQESISKARLLIDGNTGHLYSDCISSFMESEPQTPFYQPHKDFKGTLPTFQIDSTTMHKNAKRTIIQRHTRTVSYSGLNNHIYHKECVPSERDLYIIDVRQLYLPLTRIDFKLSKTSYFTEGTQAPSGRLLSQSDSLSTCLLCKRTIDSGAIICDICGKITHSGGFFISSIHGFKCKNCGRTTCREHGYWRRKYLFFKELLCPDCHKTMTAENVVYRKFDSLGNQPLWKSLFG